MAYTEFYAQSGGSNLNAGSTTNNTAAYTSTNGNWSTSTNQFTPTDGSTPASSVNVGDFASIYIDGASVGVMIGRITAVAAGVNGAITISSSARAGVAPSTSATARTIKVGGACQGPNAGSGYPLSLSGWGINQNSSSHEVRFNMKNNQTYSLTSAVGVGTGGMASVIQGYTSSVGDGGKATWDVGTSVANIFSNTGVAGNTYIDHIFTTSFTSGNTDLVSTSNIQTFIRCIFKGSRQYGLNLNIAGSSAVECEVYDCNKSNTSGKGGMQVNGSIVSRCIVHDVTGSNSSGYVIVAGPSTIENSIADTNGQHGVSITGVSQNGLIQIKNCDLYNNGGDGINNASTQVNFVWIENVNLIKNAGAGINNASVKFGGFIYNCGYGSGSQANTNADTLGNFSQSGTVTYASGVLPWVDPANGDFRISLPTANFAGRGAFQQTATSYAGTVAYPDIGAAQSLTGGGGTFGKETSYGSAY